MKTICTFFLALFLSIGVETFGQEFIGTNARLIKEKEIETENIFSSNEVCLIKLNNQTDEFNFQIPLYSILSTSKNDSITELNKQVIAYYRAVFPVNDLDFFTSGTETSFEILGELTINGITQPTKMFLGVQQSLPQDIDTRDIHSYPARVSFAIEINPADYKLDFETINFTRSITIEVRNGIVNRSTENPIIIK